MDPLAHTLTGIVVANAGIKQRIGRGAVLAMVAASNLTDIDIFGTFFIAEPAWTYRRMWTHSLLTAPLLVLLGAFVFSRLYRNASWKSWCLVFTLGIALHIFMDLINSYGVVLFFPLSIERFELAWVFIIDLYVWAILLLALLVPFISRLLGKPISVRASALTGSACLFIYLALCGVLHQLSLNVLIRHVQLSKTDYEFAYVFPEPFGPWRFRGVLRNDSLYEVYLLKPLTGEVVYKKAYQTDALKPEVRPLVSSKQGETYHWFFKAPLWEKVSDDAATVSDLRFRTIILEREGVFKYLVRKDAPVGVKP